MSRAELIERAKKGSAELFIAGMPHESEAIDWLLQELEQERQLRKAAEATGRQRTRLLEKAEQRRDFFEGRLREYQEAYDGAKEHLAEAEQREKELREAAREFRTHQSAKNAARLSAALAVPEPTEPPMQDCPVCFHSFGKCTCVAESQEGPE